MAAPKDGTFVVLAPYQIDNLDLLCAIKSNYPHTEIVAQQPIMTLSAYLRTLGRLRGRDAIDHLNG